MGKLDRLPREGTLQHLVELARSYYRACQVTGNAESTGGELAKIVIDLFGEGSQCGFDEPSLNNGGVVLPDSWNTGGPYAPEEARALGRMMFHAADDAEAPTK